ncbi:MAG: chemotaxis protein [Blastopirellula sp.]|nr:MAG: chemotaxis protein [Blastopirellula sp.]
MVTWEVVTEKLALEQSNTVYKGVFDALSKAQAVIEFNMDGTIITANDNFLGAVGYSLNEIQGQHHRMFVESSFAQSGEYKAFWDKLNDGIFESAEYKRIGKGGKEIWIQASYNPILDLNGKPFKVVKYATDVTEQKLKNADSDGQIEAIGKAQAVIEFNMDGTIITANDNFLGAVGYTLDEIQGQHHRMFVESSFAQSGEYRAFWDKLNKGVYEAAEYKRIGKGGKEIWIQASYNPILDLNGKPFKVVKYATDVTEQKLKNADSDGQIEAIGKAQAVIEFNMDGTIITANDNFLGAVGYTLDEIQGQHHRMFVESSFAQSGEYKAFWDKLNNGIYEAAEYKRVGKGGKEIWIQASYNPILDLNGKPFKVVKYATDVTKQVNLRNDLSDLIANVIESSGQFAEGSQVIAENSQQLAQGAQTQSASVEEMSASIEELTQSIESVKDNASDANQVATETSQMAEEGGQAVQKSVEAMDLIKTSSEQISEIIQVISEIASQTNLLALNAAIEAARAGEHGLGFAVVADEVRKLAERSSEAAKEISSLIKESTQRVEDGATLSEQTGAALDKIIQGVEATANKISEIATATMEQAQNANEVANAIQSVSQITEQSAAASEEMASSSEELGSQATNLRDMVSDFNTE